MRNEFSAAVDFYLSREIDPPVKTLDEIIQFNQQHADTALKYGQQRMLDAHNTSTCRHIDPEYIDVYKRQPICIGPVGLAETNSTITFLPSP